MNNKNLQKSINDDSNYDEESKLKLTKLPMSRVKSIIKTDSEIHMINQEAVFLITKATVKILS